MERTQVYVTAVRSELLEGRTVGMEFNQMLKGIHSFKCRNLKIVYAKHCTNGLLIPCNLVTSDKLYHFLVWNACTWGCFHQHKTLWGWQHSHIT